jgi:hypothetical protein
MPESNLKPLRTELIEKRAYEFYLARHCESGRDIEDWLRAERDLLFENFLIDAEEYFRSLKARN